MFSAAVRKPAQEPIRMPTREHGGLQSPPRILQTLPRENYLSVAAVAPFEPNEAHAAPGDIRRRVGERRVSV
jgi:hypothetical protein